MDNLVLYVTCPILSGAGAWLTSRWGKVLGLLDSPNKRSSHNTIIPKGGGIGILAALFVSCLFLSIPKSFWVPATILALFSLWGDRSGISPKIRLIFQFAASFILLVGIFISQGSPPLVYLLIVPLSVFVVGTANYYNFMDGINGIAGITGMVGFGLLGWFAAVEGADTRAFTLCICLGLACVGFLPFNMPKEKVFMGDVGSILLGFVFACMVVWLSKNLLDFLCLSAFMLPFYADELTTTVVRLRDRENLLHAHRRHFYQLLSNERRVAHWKVSAGYGLFQLAVGVSVLAVKPVGIWGVLVLLAALFGGFAGVSFYFRRRLED